MSRHHDDDARVVVLGGGLAGVACAHRLGDEGVRVTLVDRHDYHQFQPLLYQVATSQLPAEDIARPHRTIFGAHPTVEVLNAEVAGLDVDDLCLSLSEGELIRGLYLVVAAGAQPEFFGVPGAAEHAFPLYSVADAERLRLHMRALLEARGAGDEGMLDVVVVGGGPTGVETAGALAELMAALAAMDEAPVRGSVTIVDRGQRLLNGFSDKSHTYARKHLTKHGVQTRLQTGVASVHADRVELVDGTVIPTRTVIWAGGESAASIIRDSSLKTGRGGRIEVQRDLTVEGRPHVYAIGDAANIPSSAGDVLPQLGSVAQQSGMWAAQNILDELADRPTRPFHYKDKGIMAMIGRNAAVAEVGKRRHQVDGPVAFAAWLGVHAMLLSGAHSKADAFLSWAWDYFDRDHAAFLESSAAPKRIAWGDDSSDVPHIDVGTSPDNSAAAAGTT